LKAPTEGSGASPGFNLCYTAALGNGGKRSALQGGKTQPPRGEPKKKKTAVQGSTEKNRISSANCEGGTATAGYQRGEKAKKSGSNIRRREKGTSATEGTMKKKKRQNRTLDNLKGVREERIGFEKKKKVSA